MASTIKIDTVQTQTGSGTFNLGAAGDTIKIASGVPGADKVLTSDASGNASWAAAASGLSFASQWRLNTDLTCDTTPTVVAANWEAPEADPTTGDFPGSIGAAMAVNGTTGAWTFPDTGIWQVSFDTDVYSPATTYDHTATAYLDATRNSGTDWYEAANASVTNKATGSTNELQRLHITYLVDIVNKTTGFVRFTVGTSAYTSVLKTDTNANQTYATFIKLGDTA